jgi:hypothetical protein
MLPDGLFSGPARLNGTVIQVNRPPFRVWISSSRENLLFKWPKEICREIVALHFGASPEFIDNMKSEWIPYERKHEFFRANIGPQVWSDVISGEDPHSA